MSILCTLGVIASRQSARTRARACQPSPPNRLRVAVSVIMCQSRSTMSRSALVPVSSKKSRWRRTRTTGRARHAVRVRGRVGDRRRAGVHAADEGESLDCERVDDGFEVADHRV